MLLNNSGYFTPYHVKIQVRDSANNYELGKEIMGLAFKYGKILRFIYCIGEIPSNMTGWYTPAIRDASGNLMNIYVLTGNQENYSLVHLKYICGQYYSTLNVGTVFQYASGTRYDNRIYRDSSGAIFSYVGCVLEWTYAEIG